jgi:hypothetical protein
VQLDLWKKGFTGRRSVKLAIFERLIEILSQRYHLEENFPGYFPPFFESAKHRFGEAMQRNQSVSNRSEHPLYGCRTTGLGGGERLE